MTLGEKVAMSIISTEDEGEEGGVQEDDGIAVFVCVCSTLGDIILFFSNNGGNPGVVFIISETDGSIDPRGTRRRRQSHQVFDIYLWH